MIGTTQLPVDDALAANSTCSTSGSTATCTDVPTDGISYTSGITTVNTSDGTPGTTTVNSGVIGIRLTQSGANGGSGSSFTFTTISYDHDNDGDTADITVVSADGSTPLLLNGNYIRVNGDGSYTAGGTNYANIDALAAEFPVFSSGGGASGSLTVNNPIPLSGTASSFTTTNADGIFVQSSGGNGGNGGCTTILLATWCDDGDDGGNGGSVAVNSDGTITVNGATSNQYGIAAISRGGEGGDGGGAFGLFASDAGAGGDGGNGGDVNVVLGANSAISTSNTGGTGVFALSIGGNGGNGGAPSGAVAIGDDGGDGGNGGNVTVTNGGSITTSGNFAHGIYAGSLGAGAGSGSDVGGIVALGGRGGSATNGGTVTVTSSGAIATTGNDAIGIFAQSVGGGGGDGGSGGGLVAIGGGTGSGGDGGTVTVNLSGSGSIVTSGTRSYGILAQSVGGGGGTAGFGGGIVGIGGFGDAAGDGSTVVVNTASGTSISTSGQAAHGIYAQSIGGGGGTSGTGGGLVGIGAEGGAGGDGGNVTVNNGATITTSGSDARGIFAQSIGGGGGSANASGGLVSVGGSGSSGGDGGTVTVGNSGNISTTQIGGDAIFAQSIGGGGGSGAASGGVVSIGGSGDAGGSGGSVSVTNSGDLTTSGAFARGIFAQSVGGGGGAGGDSGGLVSIGGSGSDTSPGGTVTVDNSGAISTGGNMSTAIFAQSVGGGGGDGGTSGGVLFTLGGSGGGGGDGNTVTVTNSADLTTTGDDSHGIYAQSVGGGGGNGGNSISVSAFIGAAIGGNGDVGGDGSTVTVNLNDLNNVTPTIQTSGDRSNGVFAQSIGGGGGNGGFAVQVTGGAFGSLSIGVGGEGGGGGDGGTVNVNGDAIISTSGVDSDGIVAQSIGGGGGNGGFAVSVSVAGGPVGIGASIGIGGSGGNGGIGGAVTVDSGGSIVTTGDFSEGLLAQSVGGGGGNGGFSVSAAVGIGGVAGAISVGVGGFGGGGGTSGTVDVTYVGNVTTGGADSDGIVAQSIGGGGGNGGFNVSASIAGSATGGGGLAVGVGGFGGDGGNAGTATADITGNILTTGDRSDGLVVQSVGGGGGNGGFNVSAGISVSGGVSGAIGVGVGGFGGDGGDGSAVIATLTGNATTGGDEATAFLAQSIGGGGGNGGFNVTGTISGSSSAGGAVSVGVGGFAGGGGDAGTVTATANGDLTTTGNDSDAFVAQSLGGGGGNGGFNVSGAVSISTSSFAGALGVGIGGFGGDGGDASTVTASVTGTVMTSGDGSGGVLAQSLGGGGGNGGFNVAGSIGLSSSTALSGAVGIGGFGGGGGDAGNVMLTFDGNTFTTGYDADGVVAQSLGGGGGNGALNVSGNITGSADGTSLGLAFGLGGFGGEGGDAGTVTASVTGFVSTTGDDSTGVLAQSLGGGGGNGGLNVSGLISLSSQTAGGASIGIGGFADGGGDGNDVSLTRVGDTITTGADSDGVVAQSFGGGGGNGGINIAGAISGSTSSSAYTVTLGLGGFGGDGGNAGNVTVDVDGNVIAQGAVDPANTEDNILPRIGGGTAVLAQSIGGSGGNGGINVAAGVALTSSSGSSGALSLGVGGFGGGGGNAGTVTVTVDAQIIAANGDDNIGVAAQSIGGGGGNGAINIAAGIAMDGQITAGVGGFAGDGGTAGDVTATVNSNITASGDRAIGFLAQSIGGGGGNGGINISGGISASTQSSTPSLVFGLGGFGGAGNISGDVTATQFGNIFVEGADAVGVMVQSIAGGGGNGGLNVSANLALGKDSYTGAIGIGGAAGDGANAGDVSLTSDGNIYVDGRGNLDSDDESDDETGGHGILAQSIGGGGGNGGINVTGIIAPQNNTLAIGVGGFAGGGGDAGTVTVTRGVNAPGTLTTLGDDMNGITAQSIGGGGGNAGMNFVTGGVNTGDNDYAVQITIGGDGGDAGNGDDVDVTHVGTIQTSGDRSDGLVAQSIGGGGGSAAINLAASITTGTNSTAINLAIGGGAGDGGNGADVSVDHTGTITTAGADSTGIFAQSIGGGGGDTSLNTSLNILAANSLTIGIGRLGGTGGTGGDVTVTSDGTIITEGDRSEGILAQSVGNGGGKSGAIQIAGSTSSGSGGTAEASGFGLAVGLEGGEGGRSGDVTVDASGFIMTSGTDSHGIYAQSVGGGGGIGGAAMNTIIRQSAAATIAVGGSGGTGGVSGMVDVTSSATILTEGDNAHGIYAQSIGGGGGTGGYAATLGFQIGGAAGNGNNTFSTTIGGVGGEGAAADTVNVDNSGIILTGGDRSYGINAQSIGGGGGDGGIALNGTLGGAGRTNSLDITIGGSGGDGGTGDDVTVTNTGFIQTLGEESIGIQAQSIGGGGGNAGLVAQINISVSSGEESSNRVAINIGGTGGTGGAAGDVSVTNGADGTIVTQGTNSYGIFAQSIGGGGGNGSSIVSANFTGGEHSSLVGLNIGGAGGLGGHGGDVLVDNAGLIDTTGDGAHGIFAQSIGGGGGNGGIALAINAIIASNGGAATPMITVGGAGGDGEDAGDVTVENSGQIITRGDNAHGIYAQSIGGGGGNAGVGLGLTSGVPSTIISNTISAVLGAVLGGEGGQGGTVTVNHSGDITVFGNGSEAIKAESINGGGGGLVLDFNGITSLPGGQALPEIPGVGSLGISTDPVLTIIGGSTGSMNSDAGHVMVNITGTIGAAGDNGAAFFNQSIGGGGGTILLDLELLDTDPLLALLNTLGGTDGQNNNGGNIMSSHIGDIITDGRNTPGLILQSIGGGGGRASLSVFSDVPLESITLGLGGTGGLNESGGTVQHTQTGTIVTLGDQSFGTFAQSVGGGGGLTSLFLGGSLSPQAQSFSDQGLVPVPQVLPPIVVNLTLGANGGSGLNGGDVSLSLIGDVLTTNDNSIARFIQSVGGGGGAAVIIGVDILNVTLGGSNGAEGDGGDIDFTNTGVVMTTGDLSHGIFLQSIGGGGGAVFHDAGVANVTLSSDNEGDGGFIVLNQTGTVMTVGDGAFGIIAQSIGGGGGWVDGTFAGTAGGDGAGDDITLNLDSHVDTAGADSVAVFAQSLGSAGSGDIIINLTADHTINGGTGNGAGVIFDGGNNNELNNAGTVTSRNGDAVFGSFGNELIENTGNLIGNVELDGGTNIVNNHVDAFFLSLEHIWLTSTNAPPPGANLFTNEGTLTVFGVDTVGLTDLRGHFIQTDTGHFPIDVDLNSQSTDRLNITGTGDFDGDGELLFLSIDKKFDEYVIAHANGGMTDSGFEPFFQLPTVGFDWMVRVDNGTDLVLFADKPLFGDLLGMADVDMNVLAMGGGLDEIEAVLSIDDPFNRLINLLRFQPDVDTLGDAVASLTPSAAPHLLEMEHRRSTVYLDFAADCPFTSPIFRFGTGDGCIWFRGGGGEYKRGSNNFSPDVEDQFGSASLGVRAPAGEHWVVGVGLEKGSGKSEFKRNGEFHSRFEKDWILTHAAVGYHSHSGFSAGLTVAGGVSDFEASRRVNVPGFEEFYTTYDGIVDKQPVFTDRVRAFQGISGFAKGESGMWSINSRLRMSQLWGKKFQLRPMLDIDYFYGRIGAYTEEGVGLADLTYPEVSDSLVSFLPAVEVAFSADVGETSKLRAYVRPGGMFSLGDYWVIETQFAAAPGGLDPILIREAIDDPMFRINAGLQVLSARGVTFSVEYGGMFGDLTEQHDVSGRLTIRY